MSKSYLYKTSISSQHIVRSYIYIFVYLFIYLFIYQQVLQVQCRFVGTLLKPEKSNRVLDCKCPQRTHSTLCLCRDFPFQTKFLLTIRISLFGCLIFPSSVFLFCLLTWLCFVLSLKTLVSMPLHILLRFNVRWLLPGRDGVFCLRRSLIWWGTIVNNFISKIFIWPLVFDPWPSNYALHLRRQKIQILEVFLFIWCIPMLDSLFLATYILHG
jgi:hypothetical protein